MIVRCPTCATRRDIPSLDIGSGGTLVDCVTCGQGWIEGPALPVPAGATVHPLKPEPGVAATPQSLLEAARLAQNRFQTLRQRRRKRRAAWAGLAAMTLSPILVAGCFPEQVVAAIPASIRVYDWLGRSVNLYGLEIRQVDLQYLVVDGRKVIAIKGDLSNISSSVRKIPWLRFSLCSTDSAELFHWTLNTEARPLRPGESTSFVTRLASPPEAARNLEIRFARADEIGSNTGP